MALADLTYVPNVLERVADEGEECITALKLSELKKHKHVFPLSVVGKGVGEKNQSRNKGNFGSDENLSRKTSYRQIR